MEKNKGDFEILFFIPKIGVKIFAGATEKSNGEDPNTIWTPVFFSYLICYIKKPSPSQFTPISCLISTISLP